MNAIIDYYFQLHAPKEPILSPQQIEEYKKVILNSLKTPLLEAEIDMCVRKSLQLPIYPTEEIIKELMKEGKIGQLSNGKYYIKKTKEKTLDAWFK